MQACYVERDPSEYRFIACNSLVLLHGCSLLGSFSLDTFFFLPFERMTLPTNWLCIWDI